MRIAVCPGSFDPVTYGHLDIIRRSALLFDKVVVVVMTNASKAPMFTKEERMDLLRRVTSGLSNVEVDSYGGLLAEYTRTRGADVIVKGLRALSDFEYEFQMALTNRKLYPNAETVFLTTTAEHMYLSSSLVKQVAELGGDISGFVPACIEKDILRKVERIDKV
ncbi:MAG: pantetheine-phosphate adenylyltransferase [Clostridiales bacterium]|jgi:pantetheine-phosphate adenylyltransferase|nr:pantetheine-phosphate adenylyltransferase [Clostridiales bacterium]